MLRAATAFACAFFLTAAPAVSEDARHEVLDWADLEGWAHDDHADALAVFLDTCPDLTDPAWISLCAVAQNQPSAKTFFEAFFRPVLIDDGNPALFTGYYEPELRGSLTRSGPFQYPLFKKPPELRPGDRWFTREQIEDGNLLAGRGLELAYVDDPVDAFFLQVQGSGRISLETGGKLRLGYAAKNGHAYRSVGQELVRRGVFKPHQVSADVIKNWVRANPAAGRDLLQHNPSFVFFREVSRVPAELGPLGAMNRPLSAMRSLAVDPDFVPLGAPVWMEKMGEQPIRRLMIAQDTGSAIKGAQRADIFYGTGKAAGRRAGRIKDGGRMITLLPIQEAYRLAAEQ